MDLRSADDRPLEHIGQKTVVYDVPEGQGVDRVDVDWQVAGVSHPIMAVAEANDKGFTVLFSPSGSCVVPMALTIPEGTPHVPIVRRENLFWMKARPRDAPQPSEEASDMESSSPSAELERNLTGMSTESTMCNEE